MELRKPHSTAASQQFVAVVSCLYTVYQYAARLSGLEELVFRAWEPGGDEKDVTSKRRRGDATVDVRNILRRPRSGMKHERPCSRTPNQRSDCGQLGGLPSIFAMCVSCARLHSCILTGPALSVTAVGRVLEHSGIVLPASGLIACTACCPVPNADSRPNIGSSLPSLLGTARLALGSLTAVQLLCTEDVNLNRAETRRLQYQPVVTSQPKEC